MKTSMKVATGIVATGGAAAGAVAFLKWFSGRDNGYGIASRLVANCEMPAVHGMKLNDVFDNAKKVVKSEDRRA